MKSFFKTFFASLLALVFGGGCLIPLLFFVMIGALAGGAQAFFSSDSEPITISSNTVLKIDIGPISDVVQEAPFSSFTGKNGEQPVSLSQAIRAINLAKDDPRIVAIYMNVEEFSAGLASVDALRRALQDFRDSGKYILAYGDNYSQKAYYLSSVADRVFLNPEGNVGLLGIASSTLMMRDALDKLGVQMEVFKVGTYKAAVEPYTLDHISAENRAQIEAYISGLWASMTEGIAASRGIAQQEVEDFANSGKALGAAEGLVQARLVDSLVYRRDVKGIMHGELGFDGDSDLSMVTLSQLVSSYEQNTNTLNDEQVAVVYAEGEIMPNIGNNSFTQDISINEKLIDRLAELAKDDQVKAVVLRVNSPGGSAFLSEQIHQEVKRLNELKPVVISMGDVAASGGYYIAAPASHIVAEANTLTGSIGIFGMIPNLSGLTNKLGLGQDVVKTSKFANLSSGGFFGLPMTPMTADEKQLIQGNVERGYQTFMSRVAEGRDMTMQKVDSIGQGRVWLGTKALELGLVDELGGVDVAIERAVELAGLSEDYTVKHDRVKVNYFEELFSSKTSQDFIARLRLLFMNSQERELMRQIDQATRSAGIQARLPYEVVAY